MESVIPPLVKSPCPARFPKCTFLGELALCDWLHYGTPRQYTLILGAMNEGTMTQCHDYAEAQQCSMVQVFCGAWKVLRGPQIYTGTGSA